MSTLTEIQEAIAKLSAEERKTLLNWLVSEYEPQMNSEDEPSLESSDTAFRSVKDIDASI